MSDVQQQVEELRTTHEQDRGAAHQPDPAAPAIARGYVARIDGHYIAWSKDPRVLDKVRQVRSPREAEPFPNQVEAVKAAGPTQTVTVEPAPEVMGCPCYAEAIAKLAWHADNASGDLQLPEIIVSEMYGVSFPLVQQDVQDARRR